MRRPWLSDPTGAIEAVLDLCATLEDATQCITYILHAGQLIQFGDIPAPGMFLGDTEWAVLLSFELETRAGVDIHERYAWHGSTQGEHGEAIRKAVQATRPDMAWRERLGAVGVTIADVSTVPDGELRCLSYELHFGQDFS